MKVSNMFDKLLADYADQLARLEGAALGQTSEIEEDAFTRLDELSPDGERGSATGGFATTELDGSHFVDLDEGAFVQLAQL